MQGAGADPAARAPGLADLPLDLLVRIVGGLSLFEACRARAACRGLRDAFAAHVWPALEADVASRPAAAEHVDGLADLVRRGADRDRGLRLAAGAGVSVRADARAGGAVARLLAACAEACPAPGIDSVDLRFELDWQPGRPPTRSAPPSPPPSPPPAARPARPLPRRLRRAPLPRRRPAAAPGPGASRWAPLARLARLEALSLPSYLPLADAEAGAALAALPALRRLRARVLSDYGVALLAALPRLEELSLVVDQVEGGLAALAGGPSGPSLRLLRFQHSKWRPQAQDGRGLLATYLTPEAVRALARLPSLRRIEGWPLISPAASRRDVAALGDLPHLEHIQVVLDPGSNSDESDRGGAAELFRASASLRTADLRVVTTDPGAAVELLEAAGPRLRECHLAPHLTPELAAALAAAAAAAPHLARLVVSCDCDGAGEREALRALRGACRPGARLELRVCTYDDAGALGAEMRAALPGAAVEVEQAAF
eukprot:tig00020807_g14056.t1